jgi:small subunit ribosomal protein S10
LPRAASRACVLTRHALPHPQAAAPSQKIRIKLRSFEHVNLREASDKILEAAAKTGATVSGPVPLPTRRRLYCVLRSPHVNKNSMEHFQLLTHQRLLDIKNPSAQTIDALMQLDLPAGVDIEVKL